MIGVIADDLTGAAEIGAVGLRHGLRAEIFIAGSVASNNVDLICVDTDSRACDSKEAAKRTARAAKFLHAAGARWIYKKVDSVLRGQVTAEIEAVMRELKFSRALLAPANPSLGRTIQNGKYFVRGKPIHKTEFARDPYFPRRSAQVLQLLKVPEKFSMHMANGEKKFPDKSIIIGGAENSEEVSAWANRVEPKILPAGGAEFFSALLARENLFANGNHVSFPAIVGKELFVSGTSTQSSRKFVAAARRNKTPVFSLPAELAWGAELSAAAIEAIAQRVQAAFVANARVILNVGLPPARDVFVSQKFSESVVRIAEAVLQRVEVVHIFAEGGATAMELVRRMNWSRLEVVRELAPGVVTLAVEDKRKFWFTIKPGSYVWPFK